jgi:hypothetical protein
MDKVLLEIISILFGSIGLYSAIKKPDVFSHRSFFGGNPFKRKNDLCDSYLTNTCIIVTASAVLNDFYSEITKLNKKFMK